MSIIMELKIEDGNVVGKLKQAEKGIKGLDKAGKKTAAGGLKKLTRAFTGFAVAYAGFRVLKDIAKVGVDFDTTMRKVKAVSKATEKEMQTLTKTARHFGKTTTYTASQVGELEHELSKLGFTAKQINAAAEGVLYMAQATGSDLAQAAEIAGNVLRGFNIDAKDAMRVSDVMAMSFTSSALNITRFAESMKYAAPVAASLGVSLEETTAIMGELANRGIHGSLAGTALRNVMLRLAGASSDASKKLGGMNLQTHTLTEIFDRLHEMGIGAAEAQELFGLRSASAAAILMNIGGPALEGFTKQVIASGGAAKEMAEIKMGGWEGKIRELSSAFESLQISIFNALAGDGGAIVLLTKVIRWTDKWLSALFPKKEKLTVLEAWKVVLAELEEELVVARGPFGIHEKTGRYDDEINLIKKKINYADLMIQRAKKAEKEFAAAEAASEAAARAAAAAEAARKAKEEARGLLGPLSGRLQKLPKIEEKSIEELIEAGMAEGLKNIKSAAELTNAELERMSINTRALIKDWDKWKEKMELMKDVAAELGFALGASIFDKEGKAWKEGLRGILMVLVDFLEKLALASIAKAAFDSAWGKWHTLAVVLGATAAFEAAKGAIASFAQGGIASEAFNGRISSGGMVSGPGHGTSDSILAQISTGEAILNARAVRNLGADRINYINRSGELPSYAKGGIPSSRVENYVGDVYYNFNKTGTDPFTVFRTHRNFVRSRQGTSSLRTTR